MEWIFVGLIIFAAVAAIIIYNRLVSLRQSTRQAFADIDTQIRMRTDLIPNLVDTVKGYASHEKETLDAVISARTASIAAGGNAAAAAEADNMLTASLGRLFALSEAYPDLKANQNFTQLQSELSDIENKIAAARRFLNNATAEYNGAIEQFPAVLFAKMFGFKAGEMFSIGDEARKQEERAPSVSF